MTNPDPDRDASSPPLQRPSLTPEQARGRRSRNIAIALGISFLVLLFYLVTIAKLGPGVLNKPEW